MFGGLGVTELIVILVIVVMLFGTKKLRNMGGDLGEALKGFKKAMSSDETADTEAPKSITDERQEKPVSSDQEAVTSKPEQKNS